MKKEQIARKNKAKEEIRKNEDYIANRVMVVFATAVVMLWGLAYLWRGYDIGATFFAAIRINNILIGVSAVGLVASLIWWAAALKKGTFKKDSIVNGAMFSFFFAALLCSVLLIKFDHSVAKRALYVLIPGAAILHLIYSTYQREFFSFCLTHSVCCYMLWIMAKTYNPALELSAMSVVLFVCAAAYIFFILAKRHGGEVQFGKIVRVRLIDNVNIDAVKVGVIYGATVLLAVASWLLGAPYAYYVLYALIGLVVAVAVYYTVKLI